MLKFVEKHNPGSKVTDGQLHSALPSLLYSTLLFLFRGSASMQAAALASSLGLALIGGAITGERG